MKQEYIRTHIYKLNLNILKAKILQIQVSNLIHQSFYSGNEIITQKQSLDDTRATSCLRCRPSQRHTPIGSRRGSKPSRV
jgi:hypothetical protein